jgi:hypothetical protein
VDEALVTLRIFFETALKKAPHKGDFVIIFMLRILGGFETRPYMSTLIAMLFLQACKMKRI